MALMKRTSELPDLWSRLFDPLDLGNPMKVEELREDGTMVVRAELPGIDPQKDVEITVADGMLHVHAERREEHSDDAEGTYRTEFRYGSFDRTLRLPAGTSEDDVTATYRDGILEVRLPVEESAPAVKRIEVTKS